MYLNLQKALFASTHIGGNFFTQLIDMDTLGQMLINLHTKRLSMTHLLDWDIIKCQSRLGIKSTNSLTRAN